MEIDMQFIFGDNTSQYALLFFDDKLENASKIKELIRLPYSPSESFDSYGFLPFGSNNNRTLFFKFTKDTKMVRNVYILHGVYSDLDPEYFYNYTYNNGIFTGFIDQEKFDSLRDDLLNGKKDCEVPYYCDDALASVPDSEIDIDFSILCEIVSKLYQRNKLVIVMDDENYNNDRVRLLIKKIFSFLTPSLRKSCSYITAVDNTGGMDFVMRIIPRSMIQKGDKVIDLDNPVGNYIDKSEFPQIADSLINMSEDQRNKLFYEYELLTYGRESIYKKADFLSFFKCFTANSFDEDLLEDCDKLLGDYLCNEKCADEPEIPDFLKSALQTKYSTELSIDDLVDFNTFALEKFASFYDEYIDVIKKIYYLNDKDFTCFDNKFSEIYVRSYNSNNISWLKNTVSASKKTLSGMSETKTSERALAAIAVSIYKYLSNVLAKYDDLFEKAISYTDDIIRSTHEGKPVENVERLIQQVKNKFLSEIDELQEFVVDIDVHFSEKLQLDYIDKYNEDCKQKMREAKENQEKSFRTEVFTAFVDRLKEEESKIIAPCKDAKKSSVSEESQSDEIIENADSESDTAVDDVEFDVLSYVLETDDELITEANLADVLKDEELCLNLVDAVADYIIAVCPNNESDNFVKKNKYLDLIRDTEFILSVVDKLCVRNHTELAVLYMFAYVQRFDLAINRIINIPSVDMLSAQAMTKIKKVLPSILNYRSLNVELPKKIKFDLYYTLKRSMDQKTTTNQRKNICKLLMSSRLVSVDEDKKHDKPDKPDKPEKTEKAEKADKIDKTDKVDKTEVPKTHNKPDKSENPAKFSITPLMLRWMIIICSVLLVISITILVLILIHGNNDSDNKSEKDTTSADTEKVDKKKTLEIEKVFCVDDTFVH